MEERDASENLYLDQSYIWSNLRIPKFHPRGWERSLQSIQSQISRRSRRHCEGYVDYLLHFAGEEIRQGENATPCWSGVGPLCWKNLCRKLI